MPSDRTYLVRSMKIAYRDGWPSAWEEDYCWGLWELLDGHPTRLLGRDGGAPEDQLLVRDWSWIADALREAYLAGCADTARELGH